MRVLSTREGLVGQKTASGYVIDRIVPFVALPSASALYRAVRVTNVRTGDSCIAIVLDVGPWNERDNEYVFGGERPAAESGISKSGKGTNGAGIDLGEWVWDTLGMTDNGEVDWEFVS